MDNYCDRCGAAGKARYVKGELDLIFCGHHGRLYGLALIQSDFEFDVEYNEAANPALVTT